MRIRLSRESVIKIIESHPFVKKNYLIEKGKEKCYCYNLFRVRDLFSIPTG